MKLLREIKTIGPPCDYLYARIRCRRAALDLSGQRGGGGPADPRKALQGEYGWVYAQLDNKLRRQLLPVFEYFELRTLVIALRYLAADDRSAMAAQLRTSLLQPQLIQQLSAAEKVAVAIASLERLLAQDYHCLQGLSGIYLRQGPGGLEQQLVGGYLQQSISRCRLRPVREFLQYLLDMRNLLALHKHLRWQVPLPPPLLAGGSLALEQCENIWQRADLPALLELIRRRAGLKGNPETSGVEEFLFRGLSRLLHRAGRDPLQIGLVLDYLWRCQLASRNRGLHLAGIEPSAQREAAG